MTAFHRCSPGIALPHRTGDTTIRARSSRHHRRLAVLPALLLALAALTGACGGGDSGVPQPKVGQPAPAITATALDGTRVDLYSLKGRPVVVNFWASWCVPCREEFPLFEEKLAELGPTDGLEILGVLYKDEPEMALRFLSDFGQAWPTVADPDSIVAAAYRVVAPPQTYFIDADGVVQAIHIGQVDAEDFDAQYAKIRP
jgi:cytochrome c biogenesis protein CcmG, thiol:disulfide interchange protein DsbE